MVGHKLSKKTALHISRVLNLQRSSYTPTRDTLKADPSNTKLIEDEDIRDSDKHLLLQGLHIVQCFTSGKAEAIKNQLSTECPFWCIEATL